jgi:protocatechuate 4,5-dioxygenase beta chain
MSRIIGSVCLSHVPAIGGAIHKGLQDDPYWKPFFSGLPPVRQWLQQEKPDLAVVFYNDHGLNFFLDKMPTFAVGAAPGYRNEDEGWGIPALGEFKGDAAWSWHVIESLVAADFDITTCQDMLVDHAFSLPMTMLWPGPGMPPVRAIPIAINTVQHPLPSPARCYALGQAVGRAIAAHAGDEKVVILGTGGLSHQLDGQRAGFINKEFDLLCLQKLIDDPQALLGYSTHELVRLAGTQGVELLMWIAARGALAGKAREVHRTYHIPISNTAAAIQALAAA